MLQWLLNNDLERMRKKAVMIELKVPPQHLPGGIEKH